MKPALDASNPIIYYKCCTSFTTRSFKGKTTHPQDQSMTLSALCKKHTVSTAETFYEAVVREMMDHHLQGNVVNNPSLNTLHHAVYEPVLHLFSNDTEKEFLRKRENFLDERLDMAISKIRSRDRDIMKLQEENKQLMLEVYAWQGLNKHLVKKPVKKRKSAKKVLFSQEICDMENSCSSRSTESLLNN